MNRLIAVAAILPALFASSASAQTVSEDVAKQLWCGTAMVVFFSDPGPDLTADQLAEVQGYVDAGTSLIAIAVQGYLDAGFTQQAADKAKADIVPVVTEQVSGDGSTAPYTSEECLAILPGYEHLADPSAPPSSTP
jgi:hypothetical protein